MADSTTNIPTIGSSDAGKEVKMNGLVDALSKPSAFGRSWVTSTGLTWGYLGIDRWYINATATAKANSTLALTASGTRYLNASRALAVTQAAGSVFEADKLALYKIVTGASTVSSYEDHRDPHHINRFLFGWLSKAMSDANQTLTYEEAMCDGIRATGGLSAQRDLIVPAVPRNYYVYANTTGGFGIRVKTASGTAVELEDDDCAVVVCDGTDCRTFGSGGGSSSVAITQTEFTVTSGSTSAPQFLTSIPATITLLPDGSVSATKAQWSTASVTAINTHYNAGAWNGTAVDWFDWVPGDVAVDTYEVLSGPVVALRVISAGGTTVAQLVQGG